MLDRAVQVAVGIGADQEEHRSRGNGIFPTATMRAAGDRVAARRDMRRLRLIEWTERGRD